MTPLWRMIVGCQKPMAYEPISIPKKIAPKSHMRGLINAEQMETWVLETASASISAATAARSRSGKPLCFSYAVVEK